MGSKPGKWSPSGLSSIEIVGHCMIGIGDETLLPADLVDKRRDFIRIENNLAHFQGGFQVPVKPMFGCFGVVPAKPSPEPWHHGGNLDLPDICAGATVHVRCERDGAYFACGDGHAVQGDGEINGYSLEVSLDGVLSIDRSPYQDLMTILIENERELITVGVESTFADSIRSAIHSMTDHVSRLTGKELLDCYQLVSHVGDIRVGPIWLAVRENDWEGGLPVPACLHLPKEFLGI